MNQSNQQQNRMGTMPVGKLVCSTSVPLMISMLVQSLYNIVDGIFVSRISENALTATSIAYPAQMLMLAVAVGTGVGINSLLSRKLGQKDFAGVNQVATDGLFLAVLSSIIFILFGIFGSSLFINAFTADSEIALYGKQYLQICMLFCSGIFLATTGERLLQATGNTMLSMLAQSIGAVINIILDPILIFGLFGFPSLGVRGAAIATVIGQWGAAVVSLGLNAKKNKEIHFIIKNYKPEWKMIKNIYKVGIPTMLMQTMGSIMMVGMNGILKGFSSVAVASFGVYYKLWTFVYMPVSGLSQGLIPIIGYNYGSKNGKRVSSAFKITVISSVCIMFAGMLLFLLVPGGLLGLYDASEQMLEIGIPLLRIMAVTFPVVAVTITIGFACSGLGNGMVSMISTLLRQLVLLIPFAYILAVSFGLNYAWYAAWGAELISMSFAVICLKKEYQKKIKPLVD